MSLVLCTTLARWRPFYAKARGWFYGQTAVAIADGRNGGARSLVLLVGPLGTSRAAAIRAE